MKTLTTDISLRPILSSDETFLWEMLHLALYVPKGRPPFPRDILIEPHIACYVQGWGRPAIGDWWHVKGKSKLAPSGCAYGRL
jgi:hypothetical protein